MTRTLIFTDNDSQTVHLSQAVAFPGSVQQVDIHVVGRSRLIVPTGSRWDDFFVESNRVSADFEIERDLLVEPEREPFE